ncbi:hypothetical protein [Algibacter lectus]|uniref:hypothetical protein n=1 Tax=Algibacter lectus TaxID=221126 RepID=UPI0026EBCF26|nr:hypothetical protein [Algibacter lectus]MDO7135629.1 hypothetical protein [Algibacter lectus]
MRKLHAIFPLLLVLLSTVSFAQVGIGTTSPEAMLDVNGTFKVRSTVNENDIEVIQDSILVISKSGIVNTVLANDIIDVALPTIVKASFSSGGPQTLSLTLGSSKITFDSEEVDNNDEFDLTTNTFTAKQDGIYIINAQIKVDPTLISVSTDYGIGIYKNNILIAEQSYTSVVVSVPLISTDVSTSPIRTVTATTDLSVGDTIEFKLTSSRLLGLPAILTVDVLGGKTDSNFSIYQIR